MDLGTCLRAARDNADLKQKEVADRAGINYKTLSNWEHNVSKPNPDDLKTLANIYETSIDELIGYISSHTFGPQKALNKKEMLHIEKYRALDERGKMSVDIMLDAQYEALKPKRNNAKIS